MGARLHFYTNENGVNDTMKRYGCTLIPFLAFVLLTGCGNDDKQLTVKPQPAPQSNVLPATSSPNGTNI
ncbi:hypothetical protein [Brevibacillus choshinensis]|uniref:hypothetical protein n=1 Tax=Brevibacillus choshinensis TaxID=54911 RepID=UPI002E1C6757|nr:hypothetical protein [Brevibacillus choshinensis]